MKKSVKPLQGLFLLLLCATFLVSFSGSKEEAQLFSNKVSPVNPAASPFSQRKVATDPTVCPECSAAFDTSTDAVTKTFTTEVERVSAEFKAGKIKKEEMLKAFEVAKAVNEKAISACAATFEKCCLLEARKAKKAKS